MSFPIFLVKGTDDDSMAGAGMDEFAVFQVDAYMGGPFFLSSVVEEYQVAFLELSFFDFAAVFFPLVVGVAFKVFPVYLFIDGRSQS